MNKAIIFLAVFLLSVFSFGQQNKIDSLLTLLKKDKEDTSKVIHLNNLCRAYINTGTGSYDSILHYCNTSLELATQFNFKKGIAVATNIIGIVYYYQADYPKALEYWLKALKVAEELNDKRNIEKILGNIGNIYISQFDNHKALDYYFKALKMDEELGDKNDIARHLGTIGSVYYNQTDYSKALEYYFRALKMNEELGDKNEITTWLGNIGLVYYKQKEYDKSLDYYFKALKLDEELGDKSGTAINLGLIGSLYSEQKKYNESYDYLYRALAISDSIGEMDNVKEWYNYLSTLYEKSTIPLRDSIGRKLLTMEQMRLRALYYHKRFIAVRDMLFSQENKKQLVRKEMNYEFDKKEAAAKAEQDKKDAVTLGEKRKQKIITYSVSGGLFLVLLLALFIFRGYRQKQKANKELADKNILIEKSKRTIEEKNKDITDSINYAKRIQRAMLPHRKDIWSAFPQSFVLFKPKDIVSGDFYFFHKGDQSTFIASADCTGHGVPGAFMSMIGAGKLNDAVSESTDTSVILSLLNKGVKSALKQSEADESATRDGMDIALCSVDTNARIVKYAGANRPIWIIRNGQKAVEEIKATKKAIGGFTEDSQHFDSHEIKFEKGDTFYISTDGFADTFGGLEEKKVTTKRFKEILVSIQDKTMKEQEKHLDNFIEGWKGGTEQIDDILVIGVRL